MATIKRFILHVEETIANIITCQEAYPFIREEVFWQRNLLENYIRGHPGFLDSFEPLEVPNNAPTVVKEMARAGALANVGPMAAVAGALAHQVVQTVWDMGYDYVVLDNGGDVAFVTDKPLTIGVLPSTSRFKHLAFQLEPVGFVRGVCSSSGLVSHSFSYGVANSVTVLAKNTAVADAVATATCNKVKDQTEARSVANESLSPAVDGIVVLCKHQLVLAGRVPKLVQARVSPALVAVA